MSAEQPPQTASDRYLSDLGARLEAIRTGLAGPMAAAATLIAEAARGDHRLFVFGTGHSHMLAEEVHYRAGGLAITVPILAGPTMVHEGAVAGTAYERMEGIVAPIFDRYTIGPGDVLVVSSNSGINAAPLEAARIGRERGAKIIAITSLAYSTAAARGRPRLADLADVVLDNTAPPGDAVVSIEGSRTEGRPRFDGDRRRHPQRRAGGRCRNALGRGQRAHLSQRQHGRCGRHQPRAGRTLPQTQSASLT